MGDFVKELNVIDFLGMLLPGAFLLLFLSGDFDVWVLLGTYWGGANGTNAAIRVTLLLVGGYIVGSLLHEAGDLLERLLWKHRAFDPRTYAAYFTKLYFVAKCYPACHQNGESYLDSLWRTLLLIVFCYGLFGAWLPMRCLAVLLVGAHLLLWLAECEYLSKHHIDLDCLDEIRSNDSIYLSYPAQEDYSLRKRMLFDGFRAMCRNMFIALDILLVYAQNSNGMLSKLLSTIQGNHLYGGMFFLAQTMLLARYWRFSYLKYKYCYEDFIIKKGTEASALR